MRGETVGGPFFEDLEVGTVFRDAPSVTLTSGHAAVYTALFGDRMRLPLDASLAGAVTGRLEPLAHPLLVCHMAIGASTPLSERVLGNLFYRGLVLLRPVHIGDTLTTTTEVAALRGNRPRAGRAATGMAVLRVRTTNQRDEEVLDFWRCPMLPLRDPDGSSPHADDLDRFPAVLDDDAVARAVPRWRLDVFRDRLPTGSHFKDVVEETTYVVEGRDTVTSAPELARMTLNVARTHTDARAGAHGRRLVYGGHTISIAGAQVVRALPELVTVLAWRRCDHTGPVHEGDVLRTEATITGTRALGGGPGLVDVRARVFAEREDAPGEEDAVLDWELVGLMA